MWLKIHLVENAFPGILNGAIEFLYQQFLCFAFVQCIYIIRSFCVLLRNYLGIYKTRNLHHLFS